MGGFVQSVGMRMGVYSVGKMEGEWVGPSIP